MLIGKHFSCPAHAALNFVKNKKNILFITDFADFLDEFFLRRINAALPLNRFKNNGTGFIGNF